MLTRTFSPDWLNDVANTPGVREFLGGSGPLDISPVIANRKNYAFEFWGGGFVVTSVGDHAYDVHSMFLPQSRGAFAKQAAQEMMAFMFTQTDCQELLATCPDHNPAVRFFAAQHGFKDFKRFEHDPIIGSGGMIKRLTRKQWAEKQCH